MQPDSNTPFQYNPDGAQDASADSTAQVDTSTPPSPPVQDNLSWTAAEYIDHDHSVGWYLLVLIGMSLLAGGTYFITKEYFAVGAILVAGLAVAVDAGRKPKQISYALTPKGISIGDKSYRYSEFKSFTVAHEGQMSSANFTPLKKFMPPLAIYFDPTQEDQILDAVGEHLPFEEHKLDTVDRITRRLRF